VNTSIQALRRSGADAVQRVVSAMMGARTAGDPQTNDPAEQAHYTDPEPRAAGLTLPRQNLANGWEVAQAGAGRTIIPARLGLPGDQSLTVMPDGRIIARPMPTSAVDASAVIRG
jgi:hypothetical protein